jgi:hypothetical protein
MIMNGEKLIRGYIDGEGYARAEALNQNDVRAESLAYVLEAGMQGNPKSAQKALDRLALFERGELEDVVIGGNDIVIKVNKDGAVFIDRYCPEEKHPTCHYTISELREALTGWRDMIVASPEELSSA